MALAMQRRVLGSGSSGKSVAQRPVGVKSAPLRWCRAEAGANGATAAKPKAAPKPAGPSGPFTNTNRFKVPAAAVEHFEREWRAREAAMQAFPGFQGFKLERDGEEYTVSSSWASIPEWEAWSLSEPCRRSHLPLGIWQYVPAKGEGFPEDFVFFWNYDKPVDAKY